MPMSSPTKRLLISESEGFSAEALGLLEQAFLVERAELDRGALIHRIGPFDILWVRLRTLIDDEIFVHAKNLEAVVTNTTGLNHIDLQAAHSRGIEVLSLKGETEFLKEIRATAEHTLALCLALLRKLPMAHMHALDGKWDRTQFQGSEIHRKTVGIIGYGRLGSIVATYFKAFGAKVIVNSTDLDPGDTAEGFQAVELSQLLSESDIVSLHADYVPDNKHMIAEEHFAMMKPNAVFINTARGELVDEDALASALESKLIAGAALDVLASEQSRAVPPERLIMIAKTTSRLILTPHIAGNTAESLSKTEVFLAKKLCRFACA